jgi:hypothetical protein
MWCFSPQEKCHASSQIKPCMTDATVLLNVYSYLVFAGEGYLALVPSQLPHLRHLCLVGCKNVCRKYVDELMAAAPELKVSQSGRNKNVRLRRLETGEPL